MTDVDRISNKNWRQEKFLNRIMLSHEMKRQVVQRKLTRSNPIYVNNIALRLLLSASLSFEIYLKMIVSRDMVTIKEFNIVFIRQPYFAGSFDYWICVSNFPKMVKKSRDIYSYLLVRIDSFPLVALQMKHVSSTVLSWRESMLIINSQCIVNTAKNNDQLFFLFMEILRFYFPQIFSS